VGSPVDRCFKLLLSISVVCWWLWFVWLLLYICEGNLSDMSDSSGFQYKSYYLANIKWFCSITLKKSLLIGHLRLWCFSLLRRKKVYGASELQSGVNASKSNTQCLSPIYSSSFLRYTYRTQTHCFSVILNTQKRMFRKSDFCVFRRWTEDICSVVS
jgi:hypothetical protein